MVPSDAARAAVVEAARRATAGSVTDNMTVAPAIITPPDYAAATGFALAQLAPLTTGQASLAGPALTLTGDAPSLDVKTAGDAALAGSLPGGMRLAQGDRRSAASASTPAASAAPPPPPLVLTWSAVKTASGLTLAGLVPSEAARATVVEAARRVTSGAVTDNMTVPAAPQTIATPPDYAAATAFALAQLAPLATGQAELAGPALTVTGDAPSEAAKRTVDGALAAALPGGMTLASARITAPPPPPPPLRRRHRRRPPWSGRRRRARAASSCRVSRRRPPPARPWSRPPGAPPPERSPTT